MIIHIRANLSVLSLVRNFALHNSYYKNSKNKSLKNILAYESIEEYER